MVDNKLKPEKLLKPSWFLYPQASLKEEMTARIRLTSEKDEDLGNLNVIQKLILPHREESKEKADRSRGEPPKKMEPGTCLDLVTGDGGHSYDWRSCVRIQSFQRRDLAILFGDVTEK